MKITLLLVGKTSERYLNEAIDIFEKRLKHYIPFQIEVIPEPKNGRNMSIAQQKEKEGELILKQILDTDHVILLDEAGVQYTSKGFAQMLEKFITMGTKRLVFVVGGPYGFSPSVYERGNMKLSLSKMTFSHQLIRLIFIEQVYRGMTILKGEPYHHE
jgi:23S rRNA (pseudouridine1915-N3)-methyltransferase